MFKEDQPSNQSRTRCTQSKEDNVNEPTDEETDSILHARYEKNEHTSKGFKGLMGVTTTQKSDLSRWHSPCRVSTKSAKERDIDRQTDRQTESKRERNQQPSLHQQNDVRVRLHLTIRLFSFPIRGAWEGPFISFLVQSPRDILLYLPSREFPQPCRTDFPGPSSVSRS
mmetsp:Transcript_54317/g.106288  ORF Transcript_54317/g.106288 Transcript_54317/m.106288 type:complete len:169 (+) Transcript_54317:466-972(+)